DDADALRRQRHREVVLERAQTRQLGARGELDLEHRDGRPALDADDARLDLERAQHRGQLARDLVGEAEEVAGALALRRVEQVEGREAVGLVRADLRRLGRLDLLGDDRRLRLARHDDQGDPLRRRLLFRGLFFVGLLFFVPFLVVVVLFLLLLVLLVVLLVVILLGRRLRRALRLRALSRRRRLLVLFIVGVVVVFFVPLDPEGVVEGPIELRFRRARLLV